MSLDKFIEGFVDAYTGIQRQAKTKHYLNGYTWGLNAKTNHVVDGAYNPINADACARENYQAYLDNPYEQV